MSNRPNPKKSTAMSRAQQQRSGSPNRTMWIAGGVVVLIGIALIIAIVVSGGSSDDTAATSDQNKGPQGTVVADGDVELGTVTVTGDPLTSGERRHRGGGPGPGR